MKLIQMRGTLVPLLLALGLASCGGGGGGSGGAGGSGGSSSYSISVSPGSVTLNGMTNGNSVSQNVNVTFNGDGVVVATRPGETQPSWLSVGLVSQTTTTAVIAVSASNLVATGDYSFTLRFATGKSDGSKVTYTDVPVTYHLVAGMVIYGTAYGLANGSTVAVSLNGAAAVSLTGGPTSQYKIGAAAVGSNYTVSVPTQPTGQNCTFDNGSATLTDVVPSTIVQLRVSCNANLMPWTWVGGSKTTGDAAAYPPVRGTAGATYHPGGRVWAAHAQDAQGNLWVFGGQDASGLHNDLWKFNVGNQQWTWVAGSNTQNATGVYGTKGTGAPANAPGARNAAAAWVDTNGNFWLFGGQGFSSSGQYILNDLWKYDVGTGQWVWVSGANPANALDALGTYSTTPATTNIPGGHYEMAMTQDSTGAVWLFGGYGMGDVNSFGPMNDLWKFDPATGVWSWMSGDHQPTFARAQGTLGVPSPSNMPSSRRAASMWIDAVGDVWMFGGTNSTLGFENDLWRFTVSTKVWTWMAGVDRTGGTIPQGTYNPPGTTTTNYPTSRAYASAWKDLSGNFWLYGGYGEGPGINNEGAINDLWKYTPGTSAWVWVSGANAPNQPSIYGTQGTAASTNVPRGRYNGMGWVDASGHLWLYGGSIGFNGDNGLSDLWYASPP